MSVRTTLFAAVLLASSSTVGLAAASPDGAAKLTATLQAYMTNTPGVVSVTLNGDAYAVTIDLAPLFAKLPGKDVSISVSPLKMSVTDRGGGTWQVDQDQPLELSMKSPGMAEIVVKAANYKGSGIFDEALGTFASSSSDARDISFLENVTAPGQPPTKADYHIDTLHYEAKNAADGAGTVAGEATMAYTNLRENIGMPATPGAPPMNITLLAAKSGMTMKYSGFTAKPINSLVAFLVSHPTQETLIRDQAPLKEAIRAALPIFTSAEMTGTAEDLKIDTPIGQFGIPATSVSANFTGIVKDAKFREAVTLEGLTTPPGVIPPFAADLVPTKLTLDFGASGFDLAAPVALLLDKADFSKTPPLPPDLEVQLGKLAIPKGSFTVALGPSTLINKLSELHAEGSVDIDPNMGKDAVPPARADVSLAGFDKLLAAIQGFPPDMGAQQAVPALMLIKGMAKAAADGTLTWHLETAPGGKVTVNGVDISKMGGGQ